VNVMMRTHQLTENFGVVVEGLDLSLTLEAAEMRKLVDLFYANRLLLIKGQDLSSEQYYRFGAQWGSLITHVSEFLRVPGFPEMMCIGNTEVKDRDPAIRNGAVHWHTDGSYKIPATAITMLYARKVPSIGGTTWFCDMVRAYDALNPEDQKIAESSIANHLFGAGTDEDEQAPARADEAQAAAKPVKNALVKIHPVTGRKALYGLGQSPYSIDGLSDALAQERIRYFKARATESEFLYEHRYDVGDVLLIDCLATMHKATPSEVAESPDADNARIMWRLSTEGLPAVLAPH